jgi:hypothetical protein
MVVPSTSTFRFSSILAKMRLANAAVSTDPMVALKIPKSSVVRFWVSVKLPIVNLTETDSPGLAFPAASRAIPWKLIPFCAKRLKLKKSTLKSKIVYFMIIGFSNSFNFDLFFCIYKPFLKAVRTIF